MVSSTSSSGNTSTHQCIDKDKDTVDTPSLSVPMNQTIMYDSQSDILLALSNYHMNLPRSKHYQIIKNDKNATGRHIAICHQQDLHNQKVNKFNKANKDILGFILRRKETICEGLHYCTYVKKNIVDDESMKPRKLLVRKYYVHISTVVSIPKGTSRKNQYSSNTLASSALSFAMNCHNRKTSAHSIGDHINEKFKLPLMLFTYQPKYRVNQAVIRQMYGSPVEKFLTIFICSNQILESLLSYF